jgi:hypothetical protein
MRQQTLAAQTGFEKYGRKTKRERFLEEMEQVVPWAELQGLVEPHYPKGENGRPPVGLDRFTAATLSNSNAPKGPITLEWREKGRRVRLSVGKNAQDAAARRQRKEAELNALNQGVTVVPDNGDEGPRSIATAVAQFLEETELTKNPKTLADTLPL